jgi:hypothetical protein
VAGDVVRVVLGEVVDLRVSYDYGQLSLQVEGTEDEDYSAVVDRAVGAGGIARSATDVVVLSPHQWNPDTKLTVELVGPDVDDDLSDWDEAFEVGLDIGPGGVWYGSAPDGPQVRCDIAPGRYRVLITGRGFTTHGWPGPDPADEWRLRFASTDHVVAPRRLAEWAGPA